MTQAQNSGAGSLNQPIQKTDGDLTKIVGAPATVVADGGGGGVNVELGNVVVKRKRGRPPKVQAKEPAVKKSKEDDEDEDVCFICFDGGSLVLCDRRGCPKAYHAACVKRDEAFFRSKAKWNCGWHICSMCEKAAYHMCFTCTYSLCKVCIKKSDYVCVRGDKGFCTVCRKTIMLIENKGNATAKVDFDDKTSWEYLFKVYWVYLKGKLSLTLNDLTQAKNPYKISTTTATIEPTVSHIIASGRRSITADLALANMKANESKRRKIFEETSGPHKEWATKELLDFVAHMKNGDTSVLSQFDVQVLLLEYIKINNLRDPRKTTQIICDSRLQSLFGKPRVGHIEMLKLLELHFIKKDDSQKNTINSTAKQVDTECKTEIMVAVVNKEQRKTQNKIDEFAAIDVHNMNLIYLKRKLMESLIDDSEKFLEKVVGSIVQIRISGSDQKDDMYRLVQVVGTTKVDVPYKIGDKLVDVMLEVLNLDKKEIVSIDTISNQDISEDECRRLRESIRCGLVRCFTVGEIKEKAMALQPVLLDDMMEIEMLGLNQLRDQASQKGQKRGLKDCLKKLQLLKSPEERERRLREIPEVHSDPKMNPGYESDDTEEYFNNEHGEHQKPLFPWVSNRNTITPKKIPEIVKEPSSNVTEASSKGTGVFGVSSSVGPHNEVDCNGPTTSKCNPEAVVSSSLSNNVSDTAPSSVNNNVWHYRDPSGNVQGPFSMVQLQKWSTSGYFPADMTIWAGQESDSLLLNKLLQEQFHNDNGQLQMNVVCDTKVVNESESISVCSPVSSSTIAATSYAINSVNLEKLSDNLDCNTPSVDSLTKKNKSTKAFDTQTQIVSDNLDCSTPSVDPLTKKDESTKAFDTQTQTIPDNLDSNTPSVDSKTKKNESTKAFDTQTQNIPDNIDSNTPSVDSLTEMNKSTKPFDTQIIPDINQHVSSVFTVADAALVDLPKKKSHENEKIHDTGNKEQSKLVVQDSGNPPNWSTALSLVIGGTQLPETTAEWGRYPPAAVKPGEWESGRVLDHQVATTNSIMDQVTTTTSNSTMNQITNLPSWNVDDETIEFSTLAEESVSDLLAEVDAMESRNGVPSPTSRRNSFLEELFNGSIDDFSPTADQSTRSDGFSSTAADIQLGHQSTDLQFSFGLETKTTCAVSMPQTTNLDHMGFKWSEMIDLNDSTRAEADEGERETKTNINRIEEKSKNRKVAMAHNRSESREERKFKEKERTKVGHGFKEAIEEEGEFILPEAALPPPPPPPPPLPPLPPPTTMGLDVVDSRRERPSQVTTSAGRAHTHTSASRSGNVSRDSHHRRSSGSGDKYSSSISPRERGHRVEDSGYIRNNRSSWSRQSSFGSGGSSGGGGGGGSGYSRPPLKGQRVCKFYESGRCRKGSACNYLHPQDR